MDRSLYPEGVEVHQVNLERTEDTRRFHILQRFIDGAETGVVTSGNVVSINSGDGTLLDIIPFTGYCLNGEYVESTTTQTALQLADYTLNANNYVLAIYTETNNNLQPHETNGGSLPTDANRSVRINILNQTEFDALPDTDDNLSNDALDRILIVSIVKANGAGVDLTSSSITHPSTFNSAISATNSTNNITGVSILSIDRNTTSGTGTLIYTNATQELKWQAPGDSVGPPTSVAISGTYILPSANGQTLTVLVVTTSLPGSDQTDSIIVNNIYSQTVDRFSSEDLHHRSKLGSGVPTTTNPHALTLADLGESVGIIDVHQDLFHSNGILRISATNVLLISVDTGTAPDRLLIQGTIAGDVFYINGIEHNSIATTSMLFSDILNDIQSLFDIYAIGDASGIATLERRLRIAYNNDSTENGGSNDMADAAQLAYLDVNTPAGGAEIFFDDSSNTLSFKISTDTSYGSATAHVNEQSLPTATAQILRLYNETGEYYVEVYADILSNWALDTGGDVTEPLAISALPTPTELENRLKLGSVVFSGASTGYLGYGHVTSAHANNNIIDLRLFGITGLKDLSDDASGWTVKDPKYAAISRVITQKQVVIGDITGLDAVTAALGKVIVVGGPSGRNNFGRHGIVVYGATGVSGGASGFGILAYGGPGNEGLVSIGGSAGATGLSAIGGGGNSFGIDATGSGNKAAVIGFSESGQVGPGVEGQAEDGPGIKGQSVNGYGVEAIGNSNKAPLIVTPQSEPSAKDKGAVNSNSGTGRLLVANGIGFEPILNVPYSVAIAAAGDRISTTGTFTNKYTVPANTIQIGTYIEIIALIAPQASTSSSTAASITWNGTNILATGTFTQAGNNILMRAQCFAISPSGGGNYDISGFGSSMSGSGATIQLVETDVGGGPTALNFASSYVIDVRITVNGVSIDFDLRQLIIKMVN